MNWRTGKMNKNLLTKLLITSAITFALSACKESDGNQELYAKNLKPVTVDNVTLNITVDENFPTVLTSLLDGATNPEQTTMYPRDLVYLEQVTDDAGKPILDAEGNPQYLYSGPALPGQAVTSSGSDLIIEPELFLDLLVHPHTVEMNPDQELYSQGVYKFSYKIDNGSDTHVDREVILTVNGVEVKAQSIDFITAQGFEVPEGYDIQLVSSLSPSNTTYNKISYQSSDSTVATVSNTGLVKGVSLGDFTLTLTSEDGSISNSISGKVVPLTDPVGVVIIEDDSVPVDDAVVLPIAPALAGNVVDLDYLLLPAPVDWSDRDVTWSVSDETKLAINDKGEMTVVSFQDLDKSADDYDPTINLAAVTATITADPEKKFTTLVPIGVGTVMFNGNPNFDKPWDDIAVKARDDAGQLNAADFKILDDENSIDGPSLWADTTAGDLRLRFNPEGLIHHSFITDVDYKLSYDVHLIAGGFQSFLNAQGTGWLPWPSDWSRVKLGDQPDNKFRVEHTYPAAKIISNGTMYFNMHISAGVEVYIDNFRLEPMTP